MLVCWIVWFGLEYLALEKSSCEYFFTKGLRKKSTVGFNKIFVVRRHLGSIFYSNKKPHKEQLANVKSKQPFRNFKFNCIPDALVYATLSGIWSLVHCSNLRCIAEWGKISSLAKMCGHDLSPTEKNWQFSRKRGGMKTSDLKRAPVSSPRDQAPCWTCTMTYSLRFPRHPPQKGTQAILDQLFWHIDDCSPHIWQNIRLNCLLYCCVKSVHAVIISLIIVSLPGLWIVLTLFAFAGKLFFSLTKLAWGWSQLLCPALFQAPHDAFLCRDWIGCFWPFYVMGNISCFYLCADNHWNRRM